MKCFQDPELMKEFTIYRNYNCPDNPIDVLMHINDKWKLIKELDRKDLILHIQEIDSVLEKLQFYDDLSNFKHPHANELT